MSNTTLEKYRQQIDAIDDQILDLLAQRVEIVRKVGELKDQEGQTSAIRKSIIRPGREADMIRRIAERDDLDFPKAAVAQMWRLIISSAINIEEHASIATMSGNSNRECYWLAREYFGGFTPMCEHPTIADVLQDVKSGKATVGVIPLWDDTSETWWARLENNSNNVKIFAKIPFIQLAPSQKYPLVAVGHVDPEPTGNDQSIWVVRAEETVPLSTVQPILQQVGLQATHQQTCRTLGNPNAHHYLFSLEGFIEEGDRRIKQFTDQVNAQLTHISIPVQAFYLGAYATPILFDTPAGQSADQATG